MQVEISTYLTKYLSSYNNSVLTGKNDKNKGIVGYKDKKSGKIIITRNPYVQPMNIFYKPKITNRLLIPNIFRSEFVQPYERYTNIAYGKELRFKVPKNEPNTILLKMHVYFKIANFGAGSTNTFNSMNIPGVVQEVSFYGNQDRKFSYDRVSWNLLKYELLPKEIKENIDSDENNRLDMNVGTGTKTCCMELYMPFGDCINNGLPLSSISSDLFVGLKLVDSAAKFATSTTGVTLPTNIEIKMEFLTLDKTSYGNVVKNHNNKHSCYLPFESLNQNSTAVVTETDSTIKVDKYDYKNFYFWYNTSGNQTFHFADDYSTGARVKTIVDPSETIGKMSFRAGTTKIIRYEETTFSNYKQIKQTRKSIVGKKNDMTTNIIPFEFSLNPMNYNSVTGRLGYSTLDDSKFYVTHTYSTAGTYVQNLVGMYETNYIIDKDGKMDFVTNK